MDQTGYPHPVPARPSRVEAPDSAIGILLEDPEGGYQGRFHYALLMACMEAGKLLTVELFVSGQSLDDVERFLASFNMVLLPPLCD